MVGHSYDGRRCKRAVSPSGPPPTLVGMVAALSVLVLLLGLACLALLARVAAARRAELAGAVAPIADQLVRMERQVEQLRLQRERAQGSVQALFATVTRDLDKLRLETG